MKTIMMGLILLGFAVTASAITQAELDSRIQSLTERFEAMQLKPDKMIPADTLRKARGVILLDRTKAGFIFAFQGGGGVAMVKDPKTDKWSAPAFVAANEASLGFQVGGEQAFYVILLMSTNATRLLTEPNYELGSEARGTAGIASGGAQSKIPMHEESVLVYEERKGLYGGADLKAGAIYTDNEGNRIYYGESLTAREILFDQKAKPTKSAVALAQKLTDYSKPSEASRRNRN